jgi:autotransporter-associated beta strand protein
MLITPTRGSRANGCSQSLVAPIGGGLWRSAASGSRLCCLVLAVTAGILAGWGSTGLALDITGYSATANDRFASGFPTAPIANSDASFIGLPYDWSGVGWSTTTAASSSYKGFGFLSPQHYLVAAHYGGSATIRLALSNGSVVEGSQQSVANLGYGPKVNGTTPDLSLGTLTVPIVGLGSMARYGLLDLYPTSASTNYSVYNAQNLLAYGRSTTTNGSPRVGAATVLSAQLLDPADANSASILTAQSGSPSVQLVVGDSGSPLLQGWTNPNGGAELTVLGLNSAIVTDQGTGISYNAMSLLAVPGAMANANALMNPDGFALRVTGNPSSTWEGGVAGPSADNLGQNSNWSGGSVPTDLYTRFDAGSANSLTPNVNTGTSLRGLFFLSTASGSDGFTFSGANALTIGRGGIVNYDADRQTFSAPITLGASQYWDVGAGGVTAAAIATGGNLLEVAGTGTAILSGDVSGTGGVALSGTRLEMTGTSSYTGGTWVHAGTLAVDGSIASSSGVTVNAGGILAGSGTVSSISGSGAVGPGQSPRILTGTSVDPSGGLDFSFEFTQTGSPTWGTATASGNDVLRLTDAVSPFATSLASANSISIYLDVATLAQGDTFRGGFFTDRDVDFIATIENATFTYYLQSATGSVTYNSVAYDPYAGPLTFDWSTVSETAGFAGGAESGFVSQFVAVPEPATWVLIMAGGVSVGAVVRSRRWRCRAA